MASIASRPVAAGRQLRFALPTGQSAKRATVFVIDHDAAVRDALSVTLRASEFGVRSFGSAGEFLDALPVGPRGCLLIEFDLADMNGTELIRLLRERRVMLPAVLMSARLRLPDIGSPPQTGISGVLQKPFGGDELLNCLRCVLGESQSSPGLGGST